MRSLTSLAADGLPRDGFPEILPGQTFIFPTETVYGLGAALRDTVAIESIYHLKGRDGDKPLALYLADPRVIADWAVLDSRAEHLARRFLPGPLTLILRPARVYPSRVGTPESIGIRIPDHPLPRALVEHLGGPLVATSANPSGLPATADFACIDRQLLAAVDHGFDGGHCGGGRATAVIDLTGDRAQLLRSGDLDRAALAAALEP